MKIAIMQPYFFPYLGYFQLMKAVEVFVVYDDVCYIKQGWINRNYIQIHGVKHLLTLSLKGASSFKLINQIAVGGNRDKLLKTICQSYTRAPYFGEVYPLVESCVNSEYDNLAQYLANGLLILAHYLGIRTKCILSSGIEKDTALKGQDKVLSICKALHANAYVNPPGGKTLYSPEDFRKNHVDLYFLIPKQIAYPQTGNEFIPNLSIIDALMFNSREEVKSFLTQYELEG